MAAPSVRSTSVNLKSAKKADAYKRPNPRKGIRLRRLTSKPEQRHFAPKGHERLAALVPWGRLCGKHVVALHPLSAVQSAFHLPLRAAPFRRIARAEFGTRVRYAASSPVRCSPAAALRCGLRARPCTEFGPCKTCAEAAPKSR